MSSDTMGSLAKVRVFEGLEDDEMAILLGACRQIKFMESEKIVEEGEAMPGFNILLKGHLRVVLPKKIEGRIGHRSTDINLNIMEEGECFGEYALIDEKPASASIIAIEPGSYLQISAEDCKRIFDENDHLAKVVYHNLLRILINRLRDKEKEYDLMLILD